MSNKSSKATKKLSTPRAMQEIQTEYSQLCARAGQVQYQIQVYGKELEQVNGRIEAVNREAAARNQLDMEAKKAAGTTTTDAGAGA